MAWRVDFNPPTLLPEEQQEITRVVTIAHENVQALRGARNATVYSDRGVRWWHANARDRRDHVTVRFLGAQRPTRAHVYRDGTASIRPAQRALRDVAEEDYDTPPPFTDEEFEDDEEAQEN